MRAWARGADKGHGYTKKEIKKDVFKFPKNPLL